MAVLSSTQSIRRLITETIIVRGFAGVGVFPTLRGRRREDDAPRDEVMSIEIEINIDRQTFLALQRLNGSYLPLAMQPLETPECHQLSAVIGWIELGNLSEAEAELGQMGAAFRQHPDVLEATWFLRAEQKRWVDALQVARSLLCVAPERASGWIHQAFALRRVPGSGLAEAWDALFPAFEKFPTEPTIPYNLACYACQMQKLDEARLWLKRAAKLGGKERVRGQALADSDLEILWDEIKEW